MEETFISFPTAKLAKEKGFWGTSVLYRKNGTIWHTCLLGEDEYEENYPAPTQALLQKWLREKHKIHTRVDNVNRPIMDKWFFEIQRLPVTIPVIWNEDSEVYNSYEEALEVGLQEALKLIK